MLIYQNDDRLKREAARYLGYGKHVVDEQTLALIERSFSELQTVAAGKFIYRIFDLDSVEAEKVRFGGMEIHSKSLGRNLAGCDRIVLFAATLGIGTDRLMERKAVCDMAGTVVMQACAAALLEEYCDACQREIGEMLKKDGRFLRPRFSPGYGDFPIEFGKELMRVLDCAKKIGLTMTESCMMSPMKSVTAVIGVSESDAGCGERPCEACGKKDCIYRRDNI